MTVKETVIHLYRYIHAAVSFSHDWGEILLGDATFFLISNC